MNENHASNTSKHNTLRTLSVEECDLVSGGTGTNPLYTGGGSSGTNPLYRPDP